MSILEFSNVSHIVDDRPILDRVSWRLDSGQHWAILGANGAGKTTLLKIACGYLWPSTGGEVTRLGETMMDLRELRESIGWVSSDLQGSIPAREPVLDTVISGRFAQIGLKRKLMTDGIPHNDIEDAWAELESLGAACLAQQSFGTLSQGERQKVLIARARMAKPLVIFLDEPCGGLDPGARESLLAALEKLAKGNDRISLVMVTHHVEEIMPSFTNTLAIADGRVVAMGETSQILTAELMAELYDVDQPETVARNGRLWPIW